MTFKTKIKDSVKDSKEILDEDNKKDTSTDTPKVNDLTLKDSKIKDNDTEHNRMRHSTEEKRETKFNKIDWTKDASEEKTENKYDRIDWKTDTSEENKVTKWDKIDWNKQDEKVEEDKYENVKDKLMNKEKDEKVREKIEFKDKKTSEIPKDQIEQLKLEKEYKNLIDPQIQEAFKAYKQETGVDPNFGGILRSKFRKWIHTDFKENVEIVKKIDNIAENNEIFNLLTKSIQNTNFTYKEIAKLMIDINIPISYETVGNISRRLRKNLNDFENQKNFSELKDSEYKNLLNPELNKLFAEYKKSTGKYPNRGPEITNPFLTWVRNNNFNHLLIDVINLKNNNEIAKYLQNLIENSRDSMEKLSKSLKDLGIYIEGGSVRKFALNSVYNNNITLYKERLNPVSKEEINKILERLENEAKKTTPDSIYKIAQDFQVSKKYIHNLAKNKFDQDLYEKLWPTTGIVSDETKTEIVKVLNLEGKKEHPHSMREISRKFPNVSTSYVIKLAKELYPNMYNTKWPAIEKISDEIKEKILKTIKEEAKKENPKSLRAIHKQFPEVGADSIKRLSKLAIPKDIRQEIWPSLVKELPKDVYKNIKTCLKEEIKKVSPSSLNKIANNFNVSTEVIRNIAKKIIPKEIYEEIWKPYENIPIELKNKIISDIKKTRLNIGEIAELRGVSRTSVSEISINCVYEENLENHRDRFPFDKSFKLGTYNHLCFNSITSKAIKDLSNQKYYSEPNIYPDKRRPDGVILEDSNYLYERLNNSKNGNYLTNVLEINLNDILRIKATQIDYTNNIDDENILAKIQKYQSSDTFLLIVGTRWHLHDEVKKLPESDLIKYPENIRVISHDLFTDLVGMKGENREIFNRVIDFNYDRKLASLQLLYHFELSLVDTHDTEDLKRDLIQKKLIEQDFSEYFNFEELKRDNNDGKQLNLKYFLIP
ncbi:MAG: hypothetical protein ACFFD2_07205 [Promethearchaeota archaeon]